jgi:hypothetical protein
MREISQQNSWKLLNFKIQNQIFESLGIILQAFFIFSKELFIFEQI